MASFCKKCSIELFGKDNKELAKQLTQKQADSGLLANVLCEGCGSCQVDIDGACQSECLRNHIGFQHIYLVKMILGSQDDV